MRKTNNDLTLERNYIQRYQFLIGEYELVKAKQHPKYRFVKEFYEASETKLIKLQMSLLSHIFFKKSVYK